MRSVGTLVGIKHKVCPVRLKPRKKHLKLVWEGEITVKTAIRLSHGLGFSAVNMAKISRKRIFLLDVTVFFQISVLIGQFLGILRPPKHGKWAA